MPFSDLVQYLAAAKKAEREDFRKDLKASAFTGWQIYTLVSSLLAGKDSKKPMLYMEYSEGLGLLSEEEKEHLKVFRELDKIRQKQENKRKAAEARERAANIVNMDKARQNKGG